MRVAGDEPERVWTVEERITSIATAELLCILRAHPWPLSARTLTSVAGTSSSRSDPASASETRS